VDAQEIQAIKDMDRGEWRVFVAAHQALVQKDLEDVKGRLTRLEKRRFPGPLLAGGGVTAGGLAIWLANNVLHLFGT